MVDTEIKARLAIEQAIRISEQKGWWALSCVPVRVRAGNTDLDVLVGIPGTGLLIVEVKAWSYFRIDEYDSWSQRRDDNDTWHDEGQGPYLQAQRQEYLLRELLFDLRRNRILNNVSIPRIGSCVLFGNQDSQVELPVLHRPFTLFRDTFANIEDNHANVLNRMRDILSNQIAEGRNFDNSRERLEEIQTVFSPKANARGLRAFVDESVIHLEQLSRNALTEKATAFTGFRLYVEGAAGTGKTVYALKLAVQRARETGREAVYICYSRRLAKEIRELEWISKRNVCVATPEELLEMHGGGEKLREFEADESRGRDAATTIANLLERTVTSQVPRAYLGGEGFINALVSQLANANVQFCAVVIDEAQDLAPALIDGLASLAGSTDLFAVFADPRQTTRRERSGIPWTRPKSLSEAIVQKLEKNYRNGEQIIEKVEREFQDLRYDRPEFGSPEGIVAYRFYSRKQDLVSTVVEFNSYLVKAGLKPVILLSAVGNDDVEKLRNSGLSPLDVDEFKGLEDRCIMLVIGPDPNPLDPNKEDLYVGLTRANSFLAIVERRLDNQRNLR